MLLLRILRSESLGHKKRRKGTFGKLNRVIKELQEAFYVGGGWGWGGEKLVCNDKAYIERLVLSGCFGSDEIPD